MNIMKEIKYKIQRANKGFCDYDIYEIDTWFLKIMPKMLEELKTSTKDIPQIIIDEYFKEKREDLLKVGYKNPSYLNAHDPFSNEKLDKKIEDDCFKKWINTIDKMIFYFKNSLKETCSKKNEYKNEYLKAYSEYKKKYGYLGEKLLSKKEKRKCKKDDCFPCKLMSDFPEYQEIDRKWSLEENKIDEFCKECKKNALEMFIKYFNDLWW